MMPWPLPTFFREEPIELPSPETSAADMAKIQRLEKDNNDLQRLAEARRLNLARAETRIVELEEAKTAAERTAGILRLERDKLIQTLGELGSGGRGRLGIKLRDVDQNIALKLGLNRVVGAMVVHVMPGGPAALADVQMGDVILAYEGKTVTNAEDLVRLVANSSIGGRVRFTVVRMGQAQNNSAVIIDIKPEQSSAYEEGQMDRNGWESWINRLGGDSKKGAEWWAAIRNNNNIVQLTCNVVSGSKDFTDACSKARRFLTAVDSRRNAETEYKNGFNLIPNPGPQ